VRMLSDCMDVMNIDGGRGRRGGDLYRVLVRKTDPLHDNISIKSLHLALRTHPNLGMVPTAMVDIRTL